MSCQHEIFISWASRVVVLYIVINELFSKIKDPIYDNNLYSIIV